MDKACNSSKTYLTNAAVLGGEGTAGRIKSKYSIWSYNRRESPEYRCISWGTKSDTGGG